MFSPAQLNLEEANPHYTSGNVLKRTRNDPLRNAKTPRACQAAWNLGNFLGGYSPGQRSAIHALNRAFGSLMMRLSSTASTPLTSGT